MFGRRRWSQLPELFSVSSIASQGAGLVTPDPDSDLRCTTASSTTRGGVARRALDVGSPSDGRGTSRSHPDRPGIQNPHAGNCVGSCRVETRSGVNSFRTRSARNPASHRVSRTSDPSISAYRAPPVVREPFAARSRAAEAATLRPHPRQRHRAATRGAGAETVGVDVTGGWFGRAIVVGFEGDRGPKPLREGIHGGRTEAPAVAPDGRIPDSGTRECICISDTYSGSAPMPEIRPLPLPALPPNPEPDRRPGR